MTMPVRDLQSISLGKRPGQNGNVGGSFFVGESAAMKQFC